MFLANENFPRPSISLLRDNGFQILSIQELHPGESDEFIIRLAIANSLIILTFDRDYGELIFRYAQETPPAVIYFREKGNDPLFAGSILLRLLTESRFEFKNAFSVVEGTNVRQRSYIK